MANYQELLSKAVRALPENNGASRREVYEKARKALVTQLRAINPPLPAREITQHRLELEDCIREVEHDATEALLGALRETEEVSIEVVDEAEAKTPEKVDESAPVESPKTVDEDASKTPPDEDVKSAEKSNDVKDGEAQDSKPVETPTDEGEVKTPKEPAVKADVKADMRDKKADYTAIDKVNAETDKSPLHKDSAALDAIIAKAEKDLEVGNGASKEKTSNANETTPTKEQTDIKTTVKDVFPSSGDERPASLASSLTTQSDKGVGAAMSRVREVDNGVKSAADSLKESASSASGELAAKLAGAGTVGVGGVSSALESAKGGMVSVVKGAGEVAQNSGEIVEDAAQSAVDRAIETLDREAKGEQTSDLADHSGDDNTLAADEIVSQIDEEEKGGNGLTIFLVLVVLLLGAVGGGGYWAWKEGFIDLDSLFAASEVVEDAQPAEQTDVPTTPIRQVGTTDEASGPGNTTTDVAIDDPVDPEVALEDPDKTDERLTEEDASTPVEVDEANTNTAEGNGEQSTEDDKTEERLGAEDANADPSLVQEGDPEAVASDVAAQSLLLEASSDGNAGAVPFSGTVEWSRGLDELGVPTLIGEANIPARNMNVKVLIRRNGDPSLPVSHLMEIDFKLSETFAGGAVAGLPGILLKNEELVQGAALVGASARVVGNSFLFALSATEQDIRTNLELLETRKWMDLALIYSSGRRAIITMEKDEAAQALFSEVMRQWNEADGGGAVEVLEDAATNGAGAIVEGASEAVGGAVDAAVEGVTDAATEGANNVVEGATNLIQDAVTPDSNG